MRFQLLISLTLFFSISWQHVAKSDSQPGSVPLPGGNSSVLNGLGTPLAYPLDNLNTFSSQVWLKSNPVYGALLWKNGFIDSIVYFFKHSKLINTESPAFKILNELFLGIGLMHTVVKKDYPIKKLSCLAGQLFLFEQGKITSYEDLSKAIKAECSEDFSASDLQEMMHFSLNGKVLIPEFLPSLISSYVWASSRQKHTTEAANKYLFDFRMEFFKSIKFHFKVKDGKSYISNPRESLAKSTNSIFPMNNKTFEAFEEAFEFFYKSFLESKVPSEIEFQSAVSNNGVTWANCVEAAFTNWILGSAYDSSTDSFNPRDITTNSTLVEFMKNLKGIDGFVDQTVFTSIYQNVPFVIYRQIKIDQNKKLNFQDTEGLLGFISIPRDFYLKINLEEDSISSESAIKAKKMEPNDEEFWYLIDCETYPELYFFEVDPEISNILLLAHHIGFKKVTEKFKSKLDIFEMYFNDERTFLKYVHNDSLLGEDEALIDNGSFGIEFKFGKLFIFPNHSYFQFAQQIPKGNFNLLSNDALLKVAFWGESAKSSSNDFEILLWSLLTKKIVPLHESVLNLQIPFHHYLQKVNFFEAKINFSLYFMSNLDKWYSLGQDPEVFRFLSQTYDFIINDGFLNRENSEIFSLLEDQLPEEEQRFKLFFPLFRHIMKHQNGLEKFQYLLTISQLNRVDLYENLFRQRNLVSKEIFDFILQDLIKNSSHYTVEDSSMILLYLTKLVPSNVQNTLSLWNSIKNSSDELWKEYCLFFLENSVQTKFLSPTYYTAFALHHGFNLDFLGSLSTHQFNPYYQKYFLCAPLTDERKEEILRMSDDNLFVAGMKQILFPQFGQLVTIEEEKF